jgi:hypothetical protein
MTSPRTHGEADKAGYCNEPVTAWSPNIVRVVNNPNASFGARPAPPAADEIGACTLFISGKCESDGSALLVAAVRCTEWNLGLMHPTRADCYRCAAPRFREGAANGARRARLAGV